MRIAFLWTAVSGYLDAQLRAFRDAGDDVYLCSRKPSVSAGFQSATLDWLESRREYDERIDADATVRDLSAFRPDIILIGGWAAPGFRRVAAAMNGRAVRVLCMDNQWRANVRQRVGCAIARWYVRPYFDAVLVPGSRQVEFAGRLGFARDRIGGGLLAPDRAALDAGADATPYEERPSAFLYVGRLSPEKGIHDLAKAYAIYASREASQWPLLIAGAGPERHLLEGRSGIRLLGFVQPRDIPRLHASGSCLVMPSRSEAWGVAIVEAAVAGLPVICTDVCGAVGDVIRDGVNGLVIPPSSPAALAAAMGKIASMSAVERARMSESACAATRHITPVAAVEAAHELFRVCGGPGGTQSPTRCANGPQRPRDAP